MTKSPVMIRNLSIVSSLVALASFGTAMAQASLRTNPLLSESVSHLKPGAVSIGPQIKNPNQDPAAVQRGMQYFVAFNCVGCHAPNGGGGMGPSLSDDRWLYGAEPARIFLSIHQGRPNGMPAWGQTLPQSTIWDLVAYVQSISEKPDGKFGKTISRTPLSPDREQTPTEFLQTTNPWSFTESFSSGQKPPGK